MSATGSNPGGSSSPPKISFVKRNLVAIVTIPLIIAIHYGWNLLQYNRTLVSEEEQKEIPVVTFTKYWWKRLLENETDKKDPRTATATK